MICYICNLKSFNIVILSAQEVGGWILRWSESAQFPYLQIMLSVICLDFIPDSQHYTENDVTTMVSA